MGNSLPGWKWSDNLDNPGHMGRYFDGSVGLVHKLYYAYGVEYVEL